MENAVNYIKKSFELKNQGHYKPAIEMLYKALAIKSDNLEILAQLAHLYRLLNNLQRATYYVEKVLESDKNHLDCLLLLKDIYLAEENLQEAKNIAERIYNIQPTSENLAEKIKLLNKLKEFDQITEIENLEIKFDDIVLYEIANAYFENSNIEKALELSKAGLEQNNKNEKISLLLAKIYYDQKDYEKSKKLFLILETINPTAEIFNYLGLFKLNEKKYSNAVEYFSKAQKVNGNDENNAEYAYNLASAYFLDGWIDEALKYFNQAICLAPENINYHYALAYLYFQKKAYDKALYELDFVKSLDKNHEMSQVLNALIIAKKGDLIGAKSQLEALTKENPADDFAIAALSKIYKDSSQMELAKKTIEKAISLNPSSLDYLSDLIEIEIEQKNYEEAQILIEKMLKINEKYIYGHIATAKINLDRKDFDEVFDSAQEIIELDPSCPEGYYYNAIALFEKGDKVFAMESLKKSISLDPNNAMLYVKMSEFYQEIGDFKNAFIWAKEASDIDEQVYQNKWLCAKLAIVLKNESDALKYYSQSYRLASNDQELSKDYADYLTSVGKGKQAQTILKQSLTNKNLSLK